MAAGGGVTVGARGKENGPALVGPAGHRLQSLRLGPSCNAARRRAGAQNVFNEESPILMLLSRDSRARACKHTVVIEDTDHVDY